MKKSMLPLLGALLLAPIGCGGPKDASGAPLDSNRPPVPPPPSATGGQMSVPPPTGK